MNIPEILKKIKQPRIYEPVAFVSIFILISLTSFGFGRLSVIGIDQGDGGVVIQLPDGTIANNDYLLSNQTPITTVSLSTNSQHGAQSVFASRNGSTFYFESCGSGSRIKEENKIWFNTASEAQAAGYRIAKACE